MLYLKKNIKREDLDALDIPEEFGDLVEVTIVPAKESEQNQIESLKPARALLQQSEFVRSILTDPNEDVWNGL